MNAINYVCGQKIPTRTGDYYLTSLLRLSTDDKYKNKIQELINVRLQKGNKERYFNPHKKSF